ncbi:hypothetical protein ACH5RR_034035 [Cinchona calisaya]|uniref:Uncharacterized protein n=1 Tax=Cinchona calisaya TaxID=153742 RepID=A0ABD2Y9P4_9GENT
MATSHALQPQAGGSSDHAGRSFSSVLEGNSRIEWWESSQTSSHGSTTIRAMHIFKSSNSTAVHLATRLERSGTASLVCANEGDTGWRVEPSTLIAVEASSGLLNEAMAADILDLHAGDSRAGRPASDVEEDDERQQALEAIKSSRNAEKKLVTSRFSSFPRGDIFPA